MISSGCTLLFESEDELKDSKLIGKALTFNAAVVSIKIEESRFNIENKVGYELEDLATYTHIYMDDTKFVNYFPSTTEFRVVSIYRINSINTTTGTRYVAVLEDTKKQHFILDLDLNDIGDLEAQSLENNLLVFKPLNSKCSPPNAILDELYLMKNKVTMNIHVQNEVDLQRSKEAISKCTTDYNYNRNDNSYDVSTNFDTLLCFYTSFWHFLNCKHHPIVYKRIN